MLSPETIRQLALFYGQLINLMVFADDIRKAILQLAEEGGTEKSFAPVDVARALDNQNWHLLIDQVKLVVDSLIKEGKITVIHPGKSPGPGLKETVRFKKI